MRVTERDLQRFESKIDKSGNCWLWTGAVTNTGHGLAHWNGRAISAARLALAIASGACPDERVVARHRCPGGPNPLCVNPDHLVWGSHRDNSTDAIIDNDGRAPTARLSVADVIEIRRRREGRESLAAIAADYGVSHVSIHLICARKTWRHVA